MNGSIYELFITKWLHQQNKPTFHISEKKYLVITRFSRPLLHYLYRYFRTSRGHTLSYISNLVLTQLLWNRIEFININYITWLTSAGKVIWVV